MNTLVDLLECSVRENPERTATFMRLGVRTVRYSYRDLEARSHAIARALAERGIAKGDRVLIWAANQPDWVAAMYGTFLVGGVIVPLDVRSSPEFVERVVSQTEPALAFAGQDQASILRGLEIPVLALDGLRLPADGKVAPVPLGRDDIAEIIFTSGTTGDPKGVMLSHHNIVSNVEAALAVLPMARGSRFLSLLPLSHMFEQSGGCHAALAVGASICYPTSRQPAALLRLMQDWKPTIIIAVPQVLSLFMSGIEREATSQGRLGLLRRLRRVSAHLPMSARRLVFRSVLGRFGGSLDFMASGGAALDTEVQLKWEAMGVPIVEGYGATEASPVVSINPRDDRRLKSVGRPLPGQQVRVTDDGEVLTRGPNVFRGYWRNEAATAAVFDGDWYRTGDLGHVEDGFLYLKGRKKDLIVLADGQNVFPEDIEGVLCRQEGIIDAVVVGLAREGDVRVHAVLVEEHPGAAAEAVRAANSCLDARQQIMGFTIWPEEDFPRTHTLKVRKNLVVDYLEGQRESAPPSVAAVSTDALSHVIAACSKFEGVISDDMSLGADLGLDSLGRVDLLSAIEEEVGVFVDDTAVGPNTLVSELRALAEKGEPRPKTHHFPAWPRRRPVRWLRRALMSALVSPLLRLGYRVEVRGRERFGAVQEPCLLISNHNMHLDAGLLLHIMPPDFRQRVAVAAAASDIFGNRVRGFGSSLLGNAFPFAKEGSGVRESLEHVAKMLEEGWNVLIFPEGKLTVCGPTQPFKSGTGLLAVETGVPVFPMRIEVLRPGFYEGKWLPHPRARVLVRIGEPITFDPGTSYAEASTRLEEAVAGA